MPRRDIITKAVIGKGKKQIKDKIKLECPYPPSAVLGCWVINHQVKGLKENNDIELTGSFDINLWYSYDKDSKTDVATKHVEYKRQVNVPCEQDPDFDQDIEINIRVLDNPNCTDVDINESEVIVEIEKTLGIELLSETKLTISTESLNNDWEDLLEEPIKIEEQVETIQIEEDFIKEKVE